MDSFEILYLKNTVYLSTSIRFFFDMVDLNLGSQLPPSQETTLSAVEMVFFSIFTFIGMS